MSRMVNEIQDGVLPKDQTGLELNDDGSGGSDGGVVLKKGPWTSAEDAILIDYVNKHGEGNWNNVQKYSGLSRCGKSCRLRWANHLRPNLKKGAFTAEEEQLIAELHAKMGNKWARMAAHLPGRTDNEIKNYWNTRIKRRQRAGLPLYPPEVCLQPFQEGQHGQSTGRINGGDRGHYDFLQKNSFDIHDAVLDSMEANRGVLPYVPEFPDFSANRILLKGLNSSQYDLMPSTLPHHKRPRESMIPAFGSSGINSNGFFPFGPIQDDTSDKIAQSFQMHSSLDPGPSLQNSLYYSHSLLNGNTSASKPPSEAAKLELPSLQYPETDLGSWGRSSSPPPLPESVDVFIQSPPSTGELESDCSSPHNSGLLDALLHQAKTLLSSKTNYSNKSSNSSTATPGDRADSLTMNMYETEWEDYADPISPFGETSFLNECPAIIANGNSLDEQPPSLTFKGNNVKVESIDQVWTTNSGIQSVSLSSITRPDFLLAADWGEQGFRQGKNQAIMTDAVGFPLGEDLVTDCKHMTSVTSTSSQVLGFGSCAWNNMPAVYQMTDLP